MAMARQASGQASPFRTPNPPESCICDLFRPICIRADFGLWRRWQASYLYVMTGIKLHKRLRDMRDEAIRRPEYRVVYAHALTVAHMNGRLVADDHPSWTAMEEAILAARSGAPDALDTIERELLRLRDRLAARSR